MIALILKGYPRLSETFIAQEIRALEQRGLPLLIVSLRHPTDPDRHPIHREIQAPVLYLPEYLHQEPWRVLKGVLAALRRPGTRQALATWWRDLRRDFSRNRIRRLGQALVLARELPPQVQCLYTHFIHTPGSTGRYCSLITGLPWVGSAHARDIWTQPEWELREKLNAITWLVTCTRANADYLKRLSQDPSRIGLVYHGLDFSRFPAPEPVLNDRRDGRQGTVRLITVGRAVEKKGFDLLLKALACLPPELRWQLTHIGSGPRLKPLQQEASALGLQDRIHWLGAQPQSAVLAGYRDADLFVLPCRIDRDGDRDGLPNVLMEAQSQRLCCLATAVSGIPELILDGKTGVLVAQNDVVELARALEHLICDPALRARLAQAGFERVRNEFSFEQGIDALLERFVHAGLAAPRTEPALADSS